jgi:hypothetical protein
MARTSRGDDRLGQVTRAATHLEDPFLVLGADKVQEGLGEPLAPPPHHELVAVAVGGGEGRRRVHRD